MNKFEHMKKYVKTNVYKFKHESAIHGFVFKDFQIGHEPLEYFYIKKNGIMLDDFSKEQISDLYFIIYHALKTRENKQREKAILEFFNSIGYKPTRFYKLKEYVARNSKKFVLIEELDIAQSTYKYKGLEIWKCLCTYSKLEEKKVFWIFTKQVWREHTDNRFGIIIFGKTDDRFTEKQAEELYNIIKQEREAGR